MKRKMAAIVGILGIAILLALVYLWASRQDQNLAAEPQVVVVPREVRSPPVEKASSLLVERDGTNVRLQGTVKTDSEREALVAAVADAGFQVDDGINISSDVTDSDTRLLAILLPPLLDGTENGELSLQDGTVTVTGEALDPVEAEEIRAAVDAATSAGLAVSDETTTRVLPESVQIVALQEEINQIFELARTIEGQTPNFAVSLDDLSPGAAATLDRVAVAMRRYPLPHADIIGHTDSTGSAASNQTLSEQRAQVVLDYLTAAEIEPTRLVAVGRGESEPIADNQNEAGRADNRRVDFLVKASNG